MADAQELFEEIRRACSQRSWSRGIELARNDAVDGVESSETSATLRVRVPGRTIAPIVTLDLEYLEWSCDCEGSAEACEHAAAAVIAYRRALSEGKPLPSSKKAGGTLRYRLTPDGDRLAVARSIAQGDTEEALEGTLGSRVHSGAAVEPTEIDLTIDRLLSQKRIRSLPFDALAPLFALLAQAADVRLEEEKVKVDAAPIGPRAIVSDGPDRSALVRFETPTGLERVVVPGVALVRGEDGLALRLLGLTDVTGLSLEKLPLETRYGASRLAELISETLPRLRERAEVVMRAKRLPDKVRSLAPRVIVQVEQRGAALSLLPLVVYGDPPCARVDGDGQLKHIAGPVPERDVRGERRAAEQLRAELDLAPGRRVELTGPDALAMARRLGSFRGEIDGSAHRDRYPEALEPSVSVGARSLSLKMGADDVEADPEAVLGAWRRGESAVPLLGGGWAPLPVDWLGRHGDRLEQLLAARAKDGEIAPHARPALAAFAGELGLTRPAELDRLAPLAEGFAGLPVATLPSDLRAELRDYQRRGVDWLCFLRDAGLGAVLSDDMGLGKTVQALAAFQGRTLVVCPRSVMHNWADELRRFRPSQVSSIYHGPTRILDPRADVVITTYALLRGDIDKLTAERWDTVVLDESQTIKNPDSLVAQAAYQLRAAFRVTLSGTPVENRLEELWSQMHFANPGLLGGRSAFRDSYARPIEEGDAGAAGRLRQRIRPFLLRRTKREVLTELPPRTEAVLRCELGEGERELYDAILLATKKEVLEQLEAGGGIMQALEALLRLRQAACDSALVPGSEPSSKPSSKVQRLLLALEEASAAGHRALVFSQWTSLLDRVEPELDKAAIGYCRLDGQTRDRAGVVAQFMAPDGPPVMLISLKAGGTGLNLTAADHVFLLDPWWNPAAEDQAADRAHRIGQERPVLIYRLVAKDTVEERILELQARKRALASVALEDAAGAAQLTKDDLLALLA
jgi:superfamily II DNA or RNA helicase